MKKQLLSLLILALPILLSASDNQARLLRFPTIGGGKIVSVMPVTSTAWMLMEVLLPDSPHMSGMRYFQKYHPTARLLCLQASTMAIPRSIPCLWRVESR